MSAYAPISSACPCSAVQQVYLRPSISIDHMSVRTVGIECAQPASDRRVNCPFSVPALLACAVCPYLSINELLVCSSLSRLHHPLFDSEMVWKPRLEYLLRLQTLPQHEPEAESEPVALIQPGLSLPSLADVVRLLDEARDHQETLHGVVHIEGTCKYHTRVTIDGDWDLNGWLVLYTNIVTLRYDRAAQQWKVGHTERNAGYAANNVRNVLDGRLMDDQQSTPVTAASSSSGLVPTSPSSKQQYLRLRRCSEHEHSQCYRLLQPALPLPPPSWPPRDIYKSLTTPNTRLPATKQPPLLPLPLCSSCQPRIAQPVQDVICRWFGQGKEKRVSCLVRVNGSEVDVTVEEDDCLSRRCILHRSASGQYCARMVASRVELYSILHPSNVAPFSTAPVSSTEVACDAHAKLCPSPLTAQPCPPSTASYRSATDAVCRKCAKACSDSQPMSWCRRCWYTLCDSCTQAEVQQQQEKQKQEADEQREAQGEAAAQQSVDKVMSIDAV